MWLAAFTGLGAGVGVARDRGLASALGGFAALAALGCLVRTPRGEADLTLRAFARLAWPAAGIGVGGLLGAAVGLPASVTVAATIGLVLTAAVVMLARGWHGPGVGRSWPDWIAMASLAAAMAICFFLVPEWSSWYAVAAVAWFAGLALPSAIVAQGDEDHRRNELLATAPGRLLVPGTTAHALETLASYAALLGWPAVVAVALTPSTVLAANGPLAAAGIVIALAAMASVWVSGADRAGTSRDTTQAVAMATVAATMVAWKWLANA